MIGSEGAGKAKYPAKTLPGIRKAVGMSAAKMQQRILGRDGPRIPVIGLGAFPIGGALGSVDEAEAVGLIRFALDHGVTLVDTAQNYRWEPRYPIDASMETLLRFQEQGKARFIGVSNFNAEQMTAATGTGSIQSNQSRLSLFQRKRSLSQRIGESTLPPRRLRVHSGSRP